MITLGLAYHAFEFTTGMYYPSISFLKAEVIPEESRASVMNLARVPMNISIAVVFWNVSTYRISRNVCHSAYLITLLSLDNDRSTPLAQSVSLHCAAS